MHGTVVQGIMVTVHDTMTMRIAVTVNGTITVARSCWGASTRLLGRGWFLATLCRLLNALLSAGRALKIAGSRLSGDRRTATPLSLLGRKIYLLNQQDQ